MAKNKEETTELKTSFRILDKLINNETLAEKERETLERYKQIYGLLAEYPEPVVTKMVKSLFNLADTTARSFISRTKTFYADLGSVNASFERLLQIQRLKAIIHNEKSTIGQKLEAEKLLIKVSGTSLDDPPKKRRGFQFVFYTTDPQALKDPEDQDVLEISENGKE